MSTTERPPLMTLTPSAVQQVKTLLQGREKPAKGVRIGIRTRGCSGMSYTLEFADEALPQDEVLSFEEFKIFIDPKAVMFLIGTRMNYIAGQLQSGFIFENPNEKGRCGCGESFHV